MAAPFKGISAYSDPQRTPMPAPWSCVTLPAAVFVIFAAVAPVAAYPGFSLYGGTGLIYTQLADTPAAGSVAVGLSWERMKYFIEVDPKDTYYRFSATAGITDRLELSFELPYRFLEGGEREDGWSDGSARIKFRLTSPEAGVVLAALGAFALPLGDDDRGLGSGHWDPAFGLVLSVPSGNAAVTAQASYRWRPGDDRDPLLEYGVGVIFPLDSPIKAIGEYTASTNFHDWGVDNHARMTVGLRFDIGPRFQATIAGGTGLYGDTADAPEWRLLAGATVLLGRLPSRPVSAPEIKPKPPAPSSMPAPPPMSTPPPPPSPPTVKAETQTGPLTEVTPPVAAPGLSSQAPERASPVSPPSAETGAAQPGARTPAPAAPPPPSAAGRAAKAVLPPLPEKDIYFDYDRAVPSASEEKKIKEIAAYLSANPQAGVRLEGHADARGTASYNAGLGRRRAQTVFDLLVKLGVDKRRLTVSSAGEMAPAANNKDSAGRAKNRRVSLYLINE